MLSSFAMRRQANLHGLFLLFLNVVFLNMVLLSAENPAYAWWSQGHAHITVGSVVHLPQPLRGFFEENIEELKLLASSEPPGKHYIDIDVYPEFAAGTFPRNVDDLIALYDVQTVDLYGRGPWTFVDYVELLTDTMANATDAQDWHILLYVAAAQAHYIEDLHNPLHLTLNYNGQETENFGIHARYEGRMVLRHLDELTFTTIEAEYIPSIVDYVFDGIEAHHPLVDAIMAADDLHGPLHGGTYYDGMWEETGEFTAVLFQEASEAVANSWYTAWVNAGSPTTFLEYSADFDFDGDVDAEDLTDSANGWQVRYGESLDGSDFLAWQRQYGSGVSTLLSGETVPEPSTLTLLIGLLSLNWTRRLR